MQLELSGVNFGFYSPDELRRLSVKQITDPGILDINQLPVPNGLYDPAMGPFDRKPKFNPSISFTFCFITHILLIVPASRVKPV